MTHRTARRIAAAANLTLTVAVAAAALVAGITHEAPPLDAGTADEIAAVQADKPRNTWQTADLRQWGFDGCVSLDDADADRWATAHVVRLPVAEGWAWVRMPQAEVAARVGAFGGTATTADDVKIVGTCY